MTTQQHSVDSEIVVLVSVAPDHGGLLSLESNLIEKGLSFSTLSRSDEPQAGGVLHDGLKVLIVEESVLRRLTRSVDWKEGLEAFSRRGGYLSVCRLAESFGPQVDGYLTAVFWDTLHAALVDQIIAYTNVRRREAATRGKRLERDFDVIMAGECERVRRWLSGSPKPTEFFMHYGRSIGAMIDAGESDLGPLFEKAIEGAMGMLRGEPLNHDSLVVLYGVAVLHHRKSSVLLRKAHEMLKRTLVRRPKNGLFPSGSGFTDAPLAAFGEADFQEGMLTSDAINGFGAHDVISNEMMHFHAPTFAALGRATGDRELINQAVALCDYVYTRHRQSNGLLHHISRQGKVMGHAWGRGQTHALYGLIYTMEELEPGTPELERLGGYLREHLEALRPWQDRISGLWRNLVDSQEARIESSCTVGIAYAIARALKGGWVEAGRFEKTLDFAWEGLRICMHKDGLAAMCRGTLAGESRAHYLSRPQGWGRVAQIPMLVLELSQSGKASG